MIGGAAAPKGEPPLPMHIGGLSPPAHLNLQYTFFIRNNFIRTRGSFLLKM